MNTSPETTRAASALLHSAAALSNVQRHNVMTPEALLLALLCDPAIGEGPTVVEEDELRRVILASEEEGSRAKWSTRAMAAYGRAWKRATARERARPISERFQSKWSAVSSGSDVVPVVLSLKGTLSVGDIAHGLVGASSFIDGVLRRRAIDPMRFDGEAPLPEVGHPAGFADEKEMDVIMVNDDVTQMEFVVDVLQRRFEHPPMRATYLMYRIHACGRARVGTYAKRAAEERIDAAKEDARAAGSPLAFVYGPRAR
jgi:ATP-dependent Clp protease adaptor protein ClpS